MKSSDFLKRIRNEPENFYIIHYSCQNLNDDNEGLSPRITSVAVMHYATDQVMSFSTHAIAEELGIARGDVPAYFDAIEREMLKQLYDFVRDRRDRYWIHWNMRNATYGFEHLAHRYKVLTGENAPSIPPERRINLSDILKGRYGYDYATHPRLENLMEQNGGQHRDFLKGKEEVTAFEQGRYMELHKSTITKVSFFRHVIGAMKAGKLNVSSRSIGVRVDQLLESRGSKVFALIATAVGLVVGIIGLIVAA